MKQVKELDSVFIVIGDSAICAEGDISLLGIFLSLQDAQQALISGPDPDYQALISGPGHDHEEDTEIENLCILEVWERKIGFSGQGKRIFTITWKQAYDGEKDEFFWKAEELKITPSLPAETVIEIYQIFHTIQWERYVTPKRCP